MRPSPPKWADRFLQWFCRKDLVEFVRGDLHELYGFRVDEDGKTKANLAFIWDVLRFFRPSNFRKVNNSNVMMISNYLKVGLRSLKRNWGNSLINISGLSLAVGCSITTFLFADFFLNLNSIHQNKDNIYQVISRIEENNAEELYGPTPMIIASRLKEDFREVEHVARVQYLRGNVKFGKNVFRELIQFADPSFLEVFDFPLAKGHGELLDPNEVFLSNEMAIKYFGQVDPMGKRIDIKFDEEVLSFNVVGVFDQMPSNTTFGPEILLHIDHFFRLEARKNNWIDEAKATFVSLRPEVDPASANQLLRDYTKVQNEANAADPVLAFELISFDELTSNNEIQDKIVPGNHKGGTIAIACIGFMLIFFACLNYINIAIASATTRLKEIGVRKVMGGSRSNIATQFLVENFLTCAIAMTIGTLAAYFLLLPGFNLMTPIVIPFAFSSVATAVYYFLGVFFFLGLLSGSYPALYISRFQTLRIFKGEKSLGGRSYFTRVLLTVQFLLAFMTILASFVFSDNARYVKELSWGYNPEGILSLPIGEQSTLEAMKSEALRNAHITSVATASGHMGVNNNPIAYDYLGKQFRVMTYDVMPGYLGLMNVPLIDGKYFTNEGADRNSIVVNQLFVDQMGFEDPVGQQIEFAGKSKMIIGVVSNVYHAFFSSDIQRPMVFTTGQSEPNFLVVKADPANLVGVDEYLAESWSVVAPFDPYVSYFQADSFDRYYDNVDTNIWFMAVLGTLTIFLSCLGLYGLLAFRLQNQLKEFSIRKVLGASKGHIIRVANREFIWILMIAFVVGVPLGGFGIEGFVKALFAITKPLGATPIILAIICMLFTIGLTVFMQIRKVIRINPAVILKGD
ncbi:MAG: ABC transporter permease [Cytophagales bacterium]|nr:ABC transporter permease [Cytophagales bacterium]